MEVLQSIYDILVNLGLLFTYSISALVNGVSLLISYIPFLSDVFAYMPSVMVLGLSVGLGVLIVRFFLSVV